MLGPRSLLTSTAEALDRRVGWDKLPRVLAIPTLIGLRTRLREKNLYDTGRGALDRPDVDRHPRYLTARTLDGGQPLRGSSSRTRAAIASSSGQAIDAFSSTSGRNCQGVSP